MIILAVVVVAGFAHVAQDTERSAFEYFQRGPSRSSVVLDITPKAIPFIRLEPVNHRGPPRERSPLWD